MENPCEPIQRLWSHPDLEKMKKRLPVNFIPRARIQYQELLKDLKKLKDDYPDKAKMLERKGKSARTKKEDFSAALTKDKEISALYTVLNVTESKEEEWDEFYYLLDARYFLKEQSCEQAKGMATSKEPIRQLLSRPEIKEKSKNLPTDYFTSAQHQYQNLLEYLRKLQQDYPEKAMMLERKGKSTKTKKADFSSAFTKDKEISALYNVLKMTESKEEEWDEFYYLLDARYFLKEAYGHDAKAFSTSCDRQTVGTVLGSGNNPTHQNIEGRPASQSHTQLQKDRHSLPTDQSMHTEKMTQHTTKASGHDAKTFSTSCDRQTMGTVLGSGNNPTHQNIEGRPASQSHTQTAYEKEFNSKVIPRKSYEDLQNELVEKNKQIDELTSRLRAFETEREDLNSNPLKNKNTDGML